MNPTLSRGRKGRTLAVLLGASIAMAACALAVASGTLTVNLPGGMSHDVKQGEFALPRYTYDGWRRDVASGKFRLVGRCSSNTGLCTTVVVPLGDSSGGGALPPGGTKGERLCPPGERAAEDENGRPTCVPDVVIVFTK